MYTDVDSASTQDHHMVPFYRQPPPSLPDTVLNPENHSAGLYFHKAAISRMLYVAVRGVSKSQTQFSS